MHTNKLYTVVILVHGSSLGKQADDEPWGSLLIKIPSVSIAPANAVISFDVTQELALRGPYGGFTALTEGCHGNQQLMACYIWSRGAANSIKCLKGRNSVP